MEENFSIGDLVKHRYKDIAGIVVGCEYRRAHQYLDREFYLNVLVVNNQSLTIWERSEEFNLVQEGSLNCKA
tara:strand:- start:102 stop:317 length:216 start_codon:yes stop_codon:yes gene_type:complete